MNTKQAWTEGRLLDTWGLRESGGSLKNPLALSTGGDSGYDEDMQATMYVRSIPGYSVAVDVLRWVHILGKPIEEFRLCKPGETVFLAIVRLGWQDQVKLDFKPKYLPAAVYDWFLDNLIARCRAEPFVPIPPVEQLDANEIGAKAAADLLGDIERRRNAGRE